MIDISNINEVFKYTRAFAKTEGSILSRSQQMSGDTMSLVGTKQKDFFALDNMTKLSDDDLGKFMMCLFVSLFENNRENIKRVFNETDSEKPDVLNQMSELEKKKQEIESEEPEQTIAKDFMTRAQQRYATDIENDILTGTPGGYSQSTKKDMLLATTQYEKRAQVFYSYLAGLEIYKYYLTTENKYKNDLSSFVAFVNKLLDEFQNCFATKKEIEDKVVEYLLEKPENQELQINKPKEFQKMVDAAVRSDATFISQYLRAAEKRATHEISPESFRYLCAKRFRDDKEEKDLTKERELLNRIFGLPIPTGMKDRVRRVSSVADKMLFIATKMRSILRDPTDYDLKIDEIRHILEKSLNRRSVFRAYDLVQNMTGEVVDPEDVEKNVYDWYIDAYKRFWLDDFENKKRYDSESKEGQKEMDRELKSAAIDMWESYENLFSYSYEMKGDDFVLTINITIPQYGNEADKDFYQKYFALLNECVRENKFKTFAFVPFDEILYELMGEFDSINVVVEEPTVKLECSVNLANLTNNSDKALKGINLKQTDLRGMFIRNLSQLIAAKSNSYFNVEFHNMVTKKKTPYKEYINAVYKEYEKKKLRSSKDRINGFVDGYISETEAKDLITYTLCKNVFWDLEVKQKKIEAEQIKARKANPKAQRTEADEQREIAEKIPTIDAIDKTLSAAINEIMHDNRGVAITIDDTLEKCLLKFGDGEVSLRQAILVFKNHFNDIFSSLKRDMLQNADFTLTDEQIEKGEYVRWTEILLAKATEVAEHIVDGDYNGLQIQPPSPSASPAGPTPAAVSTSPVSPTPPSRPSSTPAPSTAPAPATPTPAAPAPKPAPDTGEPLGPDIKPESPDNAMVLPI